MKNKILSLCAIILFNHCITTPPKVVDTQAHTDKPTDERKQVYKENGITPGGMFKPYRVGQDPYSPQALSPLFDAPYASDATRSKYSSAKTLNLIGTIFGAAGGFMIGWNVGTASRGVDTNAALWFGGGASIVAAFVFGGIADGKYSDASIMYNNDLYNALELRQKTSAVKPQEQFAHYAVGTSSVF